MWRLNGAQQSTSITTTGLQRREEAPVVKSHPTHSDSGLRSLLEFRVFGFSCSHPGRGGSRPVEGSLSIGQGSAPVWPARGPAQPAPPKAQRGPAGAAAGGSAPRSESSPPPRGNASRCLVGLRGRRSHYAAPVPRGSGPAPTLCEWRPPQDRMPPIPRCPGTDRRGRPWETGACPAAHLASAAVETKTRAVRARASRRVRVQPHYSPIPTRQRSQKAAAGSGPRRRTARPRPFPV